MAFQPSIIDHPEIPGAALISTPDGGRITVPRDRLPQLGLAAAGATAQMQQPNNAEEFAAKWGSQPVQSTMASDAPAPPMQPRIQQQGDMAVPADSQQGQARPYQEVQRPPTGQDITLDELRSNYKYSGGTPGFDPSRYDASQKTVRSGQTTQVQGAREFDPGAVEQYQQWEKEAFETGVKASQMQAQNDAAVQKIAAEENAKMLAQQENEQRAMEDRYNSRMASLQEEAKAIGSKEIDPKRAFSNMGTFQKLMLVAASGLSGYATKGQKNVALEQMEATIDRDIRAQEQQLQNSKSTVDNALGRLSQEWGSIQAGKAALRVEQREALKQRLGALAAETGQQAAMVKAQAAIQALDAQQAKDFETLRVASLGETTTATQARFMAPRAATGGGMVRKSLKERAADLQTAQSIERGDISNDEGQLKNIEKRADLQGMSPAKAKEIDSQVVAYSERRKAFDETDELVKRFAADNNLKINDKGDLEVPDEIAGFSTAANVAKNYPVPVIGPTIGGKIADTLTSQKGLDNQQAINAIVGKAVYAQMGAANTDQVNYVKGNLIGDMPSPKKIVAALNHIRKQNRVAMERVEASVPKNVRQRYTSNVSEVRKEATDKTGAFQPMNLLEDYK